MRTLINRDEHRSAVELLFRYTMTAACPLPQATYDALKALSEKFDLKPGYLASVAPLVRR